MRLLDERGLEKTEYLQLHAGIDPVGDARHSGYIQAVRDFLLVDWEETQE